MDIRPTGNAVQPGQGTPERSSPIAQTSGTAASVATPAVAAAAAAITQPEPAPNLAQVAQAIKVINKSMEALSQGLEFSIDHDTDKTVVKVIDQQTKEVIRQMPTREAMEIAKAIDQLQGLLIRQKA